MKRLAMIIGLAWAWAGVGAGEAVSLPDPVTFAVRLENGDLKLAQSWLDAGLAPDFLGSRIGSGLMIGAWEGNFELMRLFLSRGADINQVNANGESAIALAAWKGRQDVVEWLLERGARINSGDHQWSPLHYAVFSGHKELAQGLIDLGADIDARSPNGSSVLMMAIYEGREDLARLLVERGADRTVKNDWGDGALEWAMRVNNVKLARLVGSPEEFNVAVAKPKEAWSEPKRSLRTSKELEELLRMREILVARNLATQSIDNRIAAERARIVRAQLEREAPPARAATLEITARRKAPADQSMKLVPAPGGDFKRSTVPPATFTGKPRMPPKAPVRNY